MFGNLVARERVVRAVEEAGSEALERVIRPPIAAHAIDDVVAGAPLRHHLGDDLRRVLQIDVERNDRAAADMVDPRR